MSLRFVIYGLSFLAFAALTDGCGQTSRKPKDPKHRKGREVDTPIMVGEGEFGLLLRPSKTGILEDIDAEKIFRRIDANSDGAVDAAEWVDYSKDVKSIWDFVELLGYSDIDDDEVISLDELLLAQIVRIDRKEGALGDTLS